MLWLPAADILNVSMEEKWHLAVAQERLAGTLRDATLSATAVARMAKALEDVESEAKVELSEEAKDLILKQYVLAKTAKGESLSKMAVSPKEARTLTALLAASKKNKLGLMETEALLADWKYRQSAPEISNQISMTTKLAGIKLNAASKRLIERDLRSRISLMAKANVPVENIQRTNLAYLTGIFSATPNRILDEKAYLRAQQAIFQKIVRLTIRSTPPGADVEINGTNVGKTVINRKPVEAGYEYVFVFKLQGYKTDRRRVYVFPDQPVQEVSGILLPE